MIVAVKDCGNFVGNQQLMNRHRPAGTFGGKFVYVIQVEPAPFKILRRFHAAALRTVFAADQMMQKDEFVFGLTGFKLLFQPLILRIAQRPRPSV